MKFAVRTMSLMTVGVALLAGTQARADFYTTAAVSFPNTSVPFSGIPVSVAGFNQSLGTLTGVTVNLSSTISDSVSIVNTTGSTQTFSNATSTLTVTVTENTLTPVTKVTASLTAGPVAGTLTASTAPQSFGTVTATVASSGSDANLAYYLSGPSITLDAAGNTGSYNGNAASGVYFGGTGSAGGAISVTYTYTAFAVPEPASISLVALGFGGLFLSRRFRRKTV